MTYRIDTIHKILSLVKQSSKLNFRNAIDVKVEIDVTGMEKAEVEDYLNSGVRWLGVDENYNYQFKESLEKIINLNFTGIITEDVHKSLFDRFSMIETLKTITEARQLAEYAQKIGKKIDTLIVLNLISENQSFGVLPKDIYDFIKDISSFSAIKIRGFSVNFPDFGTLENSQQNYAKLSNIFKLLKIKYKNVSQLSVNIKKLRDIEVAVNAGATILRFDKFTLDNL